MIQHKYNKYKQKYLNLKYIKYGKGENEKQDNDFLQILFYFFDVQQKNILFKYNNFSNNIDKNIDSTLINKFKEFKDIDYTLINEFNNYKDFIYIFNKNINEEFIKEDNENLKLRFKNVCYYYELFINKIEEIIHNNKNVENKPIKIQKGGNGEINNLMNQINELNKTIEEKKINLIEITNENITNNRKKMKLMEERGKYMELLNTNIKELNTNIEELNTNIEELKINIKELKENIKNKEIEKENLSNEIEEKENIIKDLNKKENDLNNEINNINNNIIIMNDEIKIKDNDIKIKEETIKEQNNEIENKKKIIKFILIFLNYEAIYSLEYYICDLSKLVYIYYFFFNNELLKQYYENYKYNEEEKDEYSDYIKYGDLLILNNINNNLINNIINNQQNQQNKNIIYSNDFKILLLYEHKYLNFFFLYQIYLIKNNNIDNYTKKYIDYIDEREIFNIKSYMEIVDNEYFFKQYNNYFNVIVYH